MHTKNCKNVHHFITRDFDDKALLQKLITKFGQEYYQETKEILQDRFGEEIDGLMHYFSLIDANVAEYY